jgi:phosphoribosylformimino-5-aminoimidazole carboxamide ribotide isomerase
MLVIPALDIFGGKVVRLIQGRFQEPTVYSNNPLEIAEQWKNNGAEIIHIVDLDGASAGKIINLGSIQLIARDIGILTQVGGGIRDIETIDNLFASGVSKIVLATKAIEDRDFLKRAIEVWPDRIIVSIDVIHGRVAKEGWKSVSQIDAKVFAKELQNLGVKSIIYTDISRDGMLSGPNLQGIKDILSTVDICVFASGGISDLRDLKKLKELEKDGLKGVIIGKALYERKIYLREAIEFCSQKE